MSCVFDSSFQRVPKRRKLADLQNELAELRRQAQAQPAPETDTAGATTMIPSTSTTPQSVGLPAGTSTGTGPEVTTTVAMAETQPTLQNMCLADKSIGDVYLRAAHVNELFRIFFTRCHPYFPMTMSRSVESIYEKCPLLLWVICAASSLETQRSQFQEPIQSLISEVLIPPRGSNVETVQALLILCMWPFPFTDQSTDPSFIHSGLATQISLTIGLHRPAVDAGFGYGSKDDGSRDEEIRRSTWLACFVIAQIQASRRGVPATIQADHSLLSSFDSPAVSRDLSRLCYISHLVLEANLAIGARGPNNAGLVDPSSRISLINVFGKQFDDLRRAQFPEPSDVVEVFFLNAKLQLWSFVLHNDVPISANSVQIVQNAKADAVKLIQLACEKNLALVPYYTRRCVSYAALLLYSIKLGRFQWQDDMIDLHIERAQHALMASDPRIGQFVASVTSPVNRDAFVRASTHTPSPNRSRMGAFFMFDFMRVYADLMEANASRLPCEFLDFDNLPWTELQ